MRKKLLSGTFIDGSASAFLEVRRDPPVLVFRVHRPSIAVFYTVIEYRARFTTYCTLRIQCAGGRYALPDTVTYWYIFLSLLLT